MEALPSIVEAGPTPGLVQNVDENENTMTAPPPTPFGDALPDVNPYPDDTPVTMRRTYTLANGSWDNVDVPYVVLANFSPYQALWTKVNETFNTSKWEFFACKGIHLKLTISSTAYSAGSAYFCAAPYYTDTTIRKELGYWDQSPHILVDPSQETAYELNMPFLTETNLVRQRDQWTALGEVMFFVLTALVDDAHSDSVVSVDWRIEANFIEPQLVAQSDSVPAPGFSLFTPIANLNVPQFIYQAQGPGNPLRKEAVEKSKNGLISGIAETVSTVSAKLEDVPLIGGIAKGVNVVANAVGAVAKWFGFSKPIMQSTTTPVMRQLMWGDTHARGITNATALSSSPDPTVATDARLVRTSGDEASIDKIKSLPNLIATGLILETATVGEMVMRIPVNPFKVYKIGVSDVLPNHLSYVTSLFTLWRGSLDFRFYFPMSKMRRMRLALTWSPEAVVTYSENLRRIEFTTSESTTVDISVPWCEISRYMRCYTPQSDSDTAGATNGFLTLWVLDRMTVAGQAGAVRQDILVYMAGGADFQLAAPIGLTSATHGYKPYTAETHALLKKLELSTETEKVPRFKAHGALGGATGCKIYGFSAEDDISSLRELAHRITRGALFTPASGVIIDPTPININNLCNYILKKFLFWRGSSNVHVRMVDASTTMQIIRDDKGFNGNTLNLGSYDSGLVYCRESGYIVINCPYLWPNDCKTNNQYLVASTSSDYAPPGYRITTSTQVETMYSMGDDLSLGILLPSPIYSFSL